MIPTQTAPGLPIPAPARVERFALPEQRPLMQRVQTAMIEGARNPWVRDVALSLTRDMDWRDRAAIAHKLLRWVQTRIQYVEDPAFTDLVQEADYTLERRTGDCVAQTVLLGALLMARGIPATALYQNPDGLGIAHVMVLADIEGDGSGLPLDPIDYQKPATHVPGGTLYVARGAGRTTTLEDWSMLATSKNRRAVGWSGIGTLVARRAIGQVTWACNAYEGSGATQRAGETDEMFAIRQKACENELTSKSAATQLQTAGAEGGSSAWDAFWGAFGGALPGAYFSTKGTSATTYAGSLTRPPAPPATSTIFGMSPIVVVGLLALIAWAFMRARRSRAKAA